VGFQSLASEFPNDNVRISAGAVWICPELIGPARPELAPYEPVAAEPFVLFFDDEDGYVDGPIDIQATGSALHIAVTPLEEEPESEPDRAVASDEPELMTEPELAPAFAHFQGALASVLMAQGASRAAALVPRLLRLEALPPDALAKEARLTLQSRGYLDDCTRYTQRYRELCSAWTAVLSGSSQDFAACGTTTLDRFGAELLAALLAVPATRADELRRELRKAGVAAFGVLAAAA
jgi:hypothetical protein